jgi:beta-lactamase regulating signal transducer with metallopeptidase domain
MGSLTVETAASALLTMAIKASVLLSVAVVCQATFFRRSAAATRHFVWTLALAGMMLLPVASTVLPVWGVPISSADAPSVSPQASVRVDEPNAESSTQVVLPPAAMPLQSSTTSWTAVPWAAVGLAVYVIGLCLSLVRLALQQAAARRLVRRADPLRDEAWTALLTECAERMRVRRRVALLRGRERTMPIVIGTRHPRILIPSVADTWADDRREAVMLHELAHVVRHDCLVQMVAAGACAMYWFHPGVWWVARRTLIERELACDDRVIITGTTGTAGGDGRAYAGHLLEIAYSNRAGATALALGMARKHQLEGRLMAALDNSRNRRVPAARLILTVAASATVLVLAVAAARPVAARQPAPIPASSDTQTADIDPNVKAGIEAMHALSRVSPRDAMRAAARMFGVPQVAAPGTWEIRPAGTPGSVQLRLIEEHSSNGSTVRLDQFEGLSASDIAKADGPVRFRMRRDAGTFSFDGVMHAAVGAGTFSFTPDPNFPSELARRGFARPSAEEQYELAREDIGFAFIDELTKQGYAKPQTAELVRAGQHGVSLTYLREMGTLDHRFQSLDALVVLRDHGVTPSYIRELADLGYKGLSSEGLRNARDHGITPDYVRAMRELGFGTLTMPELINARDHGVSVAFVRAMAADGHPKLPLDQLIRIRDHGVTPEYMRDMRQLGYALPLEDFVRARDHGVSVDVVRDMAALGYAGVPIETLIRARDHGVSPDYVRDLKSLGYERLPLDDLILLRDHGLSADRIRTANARAGTRLPVDVLKSLAGR